MLVSAVQKLTLLDYPNHTACIVFTPGCNFRCGYCHNPEFVLPEMIAEIKNSFIDEENFFAFLETRKGKIDGVVVTGGEPTMMGDLPVFLQKIQDAGFLVKLDTNGNNPSMLEKILDQKLVDYVAMDVKTSLGEYKKLVGERASETNLARSIELIKTQTPDYEFRSTLIKEIHTPEILASMAELLRGSKKLFLQNFRPATTLNPLFSTFHPFSESEMGDIMKMFQQTVEFVEVR
jgi:pyruvate formate lyase activating enzyme